jgi:hypothetical protein
MNYFTGPVKDFIVAMKRFVVGLNRFGVSRRGYQVAFRCSQGLRSVRRRSRPPSRAPRKEYLSCLAKTPHL